MASNRGYNAIHLSLARRRQQDQGDELARYAQQAEAIVKQEPLELKDRPIKGDPDKESEMPATDVPMTLDVDKEVSFYSGALAEFDGNRKRIEKLLAKETVSLMDIEVAKELEGPAIAFLDALNDPGKSKLRRWATSLHELHRQVTGRMNALAATPQALRDVCRRLYTKRDTQERARINRERLEREKAIREEQERARQAEIEAAKASGATEEEVQSVATAPMPVISAPEPKEAAKIEGVSMVYSAKFGQITDYAAFTKWLVEHPDDMAGFDPKVSYWKNKLSAHLNKETGVMSIEIPGLKIIVETSPRRTNG